MASPIEHYALIGDCRSAALVSLHGSVDWLCWPRFDSGACFAALVGDEDTGRWQIAPTSRNQTVSRRYLTDTLVLETRFATAVAKSSSSISCRKTATHRISFASSKACPAAFQ